MAYLVHLHQFEGPLGLLLHLIRKEEMDIFNINIYEITKQYLDYIRMMKELDLEVAGEFIAMAATLIHIKSQMLLPQYNEQGQVVEQEDPRKELVQKLLEYQKFQETAKKLYERPLLGREVWARGAKEAFVDLGPGEILLEEDGLFSLIGSYRRAIKRMKKAVHRVKEKGMSIAARILQIKERLIVGRQITLNELLKTTDGGGMSLRLQILITFLSVLELGRMGFVSVFQNENYGEIYIDPQRQVEGNLLERVQEFDSADSEDVARHIMEDATDEVIEAGEDEVAILGDIEDKGQEGASSPVASDEEIENAERELEG